MAVDRGSASSRSTLRLQARLTRQHLQGEGDADPVAPNLLAAMAGYLDQEKGW
jgi:hypothetical protein